MKSSCSMPVGTSDNQYVLVSPAYRMALPPLRRRRSDHIQRQRQCVDIVHTFRPGLARTTAGLARIPHVSATSQQ